MHFVFDVGLRWFFCSLSLLQVARHLGLKESRSLKEDVWGEVTSKGKPLSEYRKSYFDMGAPVTPKKQLHNLSRLDSNTFGRLYFLYPTLSPTLRTFSYI
jgi:hypothetical protein